jgi:hypothetical protein
MVITPLFCCSKSYFTRKKLKKILKTGLIFDQPCQEVDLTKILEVIFFAPRETQETRFLGALICSSQRKNNISKVVLFFY